jgi:prenyl protein peptidase
MVTTTTTLILVVEGTSTTPVDGLHLLGWWPVFPVESVLAPLLLTLILFLGPLFEKLLVETSFRPFTLFQEVPASLRSHIGYRNFVAGPITEEVLFRSCLIPLQLLARSSLKVTIFTTPLYFGIAHIHHLYEFTLTHPDHSWVPILLRSFFQFTYTTLFGWFASFVYLRTGSLYACVLIHAFCNWAGFPRVWGKLQRRESFVAVGPYGPVARSKEDAGSVTEVRRVE